MPGDIDGDGHLDLLASGRSPPTDPMVLLGTGGGGFHVDEQELFADGIFRPVGFAIGRFNADPQGDLIGTMKRFDLAAAPRRTESRTSSWAATAGA